MQALQALQHLFLVVHALTKLFTPAPSAIAPVTPTPTVIDQTPFPRDPVLGSTLTVILLIIGKLNHLSLVLTYSLAKHFVPTTVVAIGCETNQSRGCFFLRLST